MATKIKALKCPNCGSEKHIDLGNKRFLCKSCGTEFYIDDDDITINVNHHFDYGGMSLVQPKKVLAIFTISAIVLIGVFLFSMFTTALFGIATDSDRSSLYDFEKTINVDNDYKFIVPMHHGKDICFFYLTERRYNQYSDTARQYINGYYWGFIDSNTGKVLNEQLFIKDTDTEKMAEFYSSYIALRYFYQAKKWYMLFPGHHIFEVNSKNLTVKDVSKSLFAKKPAMESGISLAKFIDEEYGEGIFVSNNMAVPYYYFPATDRLYTKEAYEYARELPPSELGNEQRDSTYYTLQKKTVNSDLGVGGRYRLWRINYKYHLGDPQDNKYFSSDMEHVWNDNKRLISYEPATEWFTAFDCSIVFSDSKYILLKYYPNVSKEVNTVLQLRSTTGEILWTKSLNERISSFTALRDKTKFWFKARSEKYERMETDYCYSVNLVNGEWKRHYYFPIDSKIIKE